MGSYEVISIKRLKIDEMLKWIEFLWGSTSIYNEYLNKYSNVFYNRIDFYNKDIFIKTYTTFQFESVSGKRTKFVEDLNLQWIFYDDLVRIAPAIHYRILPNEIVIDLDFKTTDEKIKEKVLMYIISELNILGIKPLVAHSGGKGYHIHFLIGPPNGELHDFIELGYSQLKPFTNTVAEWLIDKISGSVWNLEKYCELRSLFYDSCDKQVLKDIHTIRMLYSFNIKDGRIVGYKYIVNFSNVECSNQYYVWYLPRKLYQRFLDRMIFEKNIESDRIKLFENFNTEKRVKNVNKIRWIEKILENPEKIHDGRRRLIMYVLVPYLLNLRKIQSEKVKEILEDWVNKTPYGMSSDIKSLIKSELNSYLRHPEILPMAREKFFERNPDLKYILEVIK